ncbi:MAG TPA: hypothetical protein VGR38_01230 [Candidatus Polarisedimenticolia bacterium]|jgi:hypothetical protein|nr:hypothetical protein [Candidatus Polarisedimenticolia bacterium]
MAERSFSKLLVEIGVDLAAFSRDLKKASAGFTSFGKELQKIGKDLTVAISAPIAGFAAAALASSTVATTAFEVFGSSVKDSLGLVGTTIFRSLNVQGILDSVASALAGVARAFSSLPSVVQTSIVVVGGFVALLGPALVVLGQLTIVVGKLAAGWALLLRTVAGIGLGPWGLLITAIVGLGVAVAAINFSRPRDEIERVGTAAEISARKVKEAQRIIDSFSSISTEETAKQLAKLRAELKELNEEASGGGLISAGLKSRIREVTTLIQNLTGEGQVRAARETVASEKIKQAWGRELEAMKGVAAEYSITGDVAEKLRGRIAALSATINVLKAAPSVGGPELAQALGERSNLEERLQLLQEARQEIAEIDREAQSSKAHFEEINDPILQIKKALEAVGTVAQQVGQAVASLVSQVVSGIGNAVARAIVFGESLAKSMKNLLKEVAASIISTLIQITLQAVIGAAIQAAVQTYVNAQRELSLFGLVVGVGLAAAAAAAVYAVAASAGAAEGGIFTTPGMTRIAEKGEPEIVLNQENVHRFFGKSVFGVGRAEIHVHTHLNGREIAHEIVPEIPSVLRFHGVNI